MKKLALLFDLDGTLINSLGDICGHLNHVRRDYGLAERSFEELRPCIGRGIQYLARVANPEVDEEEVPKIVEKFRDYYIETPHVGGSLYTGVRETLNVLDSRSDIQIGVATNKLSLVAERTLDYYLPGISFDAIAGPDRVSAKKPDPAHILEVLEKLSCEPKDAWYVGDHNVDYECARAANVRFLGATYGFGQVEVEPEQGLCSFSELLNKIGINSKT